MEKYKSVFFLVFSVVFLVIFSSCSKYKYEGKDVSSIEYVAVDYNGGYTRETIVDLIDCQVLNREFLPSDNIIEEYSINYRFEMGSISLFLDEVGEAGLFDLNDNYPSPGGIADGGGWTLTIYYADGTIKASSGDNNYPADVFRNADYAFYDLYGDDLFGTLPSSYTNPPSIDISFDYSIGSNHYSQGYSGVSPINYSWNKSMVSDVNVVSYAIQNPLQEFDISYNYKFVLWTANYEYRFSKMIITSFDLNGNDAKGIDNSGWFKQKEYTLELNRIYVIKMTFSYGTCEYAFSTAVLDT